MPRRQQSKNSNRPDRIAAKVQNIVAQILSEKYGDDPIVSGVSLVDAQSRGGLQFVRLFYYSRETDIAVVQKRLDEITRAVRFELASRIDQKYVPEIRFEYDDTLDRAARIDKLLGDLNVG